MEILSVLAPYIVALFSLFVTLCTIRTNFISGEMSKKNDVERRRIAQFLDDAAELNSLLLILAYVGWNENGAEFKKQVKNNVPKFVSLKMRIEFVLRKGNRPDEEIFEQLTDLVQFFAFAWDAELGVGDDPPHWLRTYSETLSWLCVQWARRRYRSLARRVVK